MANQQVPKPMPKVKRSLLPLDGGEDYTPSAFLTYISLTGSNRVDRIPLVGNRVSLGRAFTNQIIFNSSQISRQHAILEYRKNVGKWFLQDKSTNGIKVNDVKCSKTDWFLLDNEDIIYFLPPVVAYRINYTNPSTIIPIQSACPKHIHIHRQCIPVQQKIQASQELCGQKSPPNVIDISSSSSEADDKDTVADAVASASPGFSDQDAAKLVNDYKEKCQVLEEQMLNQKLELEKRLDQIKGEKDEFRQKIDEYQQKCVALEEENLNKKSELEKQLDQIKNEKDEFRQKIDEYQQKLETLEEEKLNEKLELEKRLDEIKTERDEFFQNICWYEKKCDTLVFEKLELRLEHKKQIVQMLLGKTEHLNLLDEYDKKYRALEVEKLNEKMEFEKQLELVKSEKEKIVQKLHEFLETDFTCSICSEVFIEAAVLGYCGHTFCNTCISSWFQKKLDCPICRKPISSKSVHIELKNFINKVYDLMPDEISAKRAKYVEERQLIDTKMTAVLFENMLQFQQISNMNNLLVSVLGGNGEQSQPATTTTTRPRRNGRVPRIIRVRAQGGQGQRQARTVPTSSVREENSIADATTTTETIPDVVPPSPEDEAMVGV